jgi:hypothetical protein
MCMLVREIPPERRLQFWSHYVVLKLMFNMDVKSYVLMADVNILCVRDVVKV